MYKVIRFFDDLQDNNYRYNVGDTFPRVGVGVSDTRLNELASGANKQGRPLIQFVEDKTEAKENPAAADEKPKKASTGKRKAAEK